MSIVSPNRFTPGTFGVRAGLPVGPAQAADPSRDRLILIEVTTVGGKATKIEFEVGGVKVSNNEIPVGVAEVREVPFAIVVPAGLTYKLNTNAGVKEAFQNILFLN